MPRGEMGKGPRAGSVRVSHRLPMSWPRQQLDPCFSPLSSLSSPEAARGTSPVPVALGGSACQSLMLWSRCMKSCAENYSTGGVHLHAAADKDPVTSLCSSSSLQHTWRSPRLSAVAA